MYRLNSNRTYGYRALNTLIAASLAAASCTSPVVQVPLEGTGPLQGTIEHKLNDSNARRFILSVRPTSSSPPLGVKYNQKGLIEVILPYAVVEDAGQNPQIIDIACIPSKYPTPVQMFDVKCYLDGQANKSGDEYLVTSMNRWVKMINALQEFMLKLAKSPIGAEENRKKR